MEREILTTNEAAEFLRLSEITVRLYARRGFLPARKAGKGWRFCKSDLLSWVRDGNAAPPQEQAQEK